MAKHDPSGGDTSAPDWKKTTVYLRKDQIRRLKQAGLDSEVTMSDVLRRAIDHYFGEDDEDQQLSGRQREVLGQVLRDRLSLEESHLTDILTALDRAAEESD